MQRPDEVDSVVYLLETVSDTRTHYTGAVSPRVREEFRLSRDSPNVIGRNQAEATIFVADGMVARRHCKIFWNSTTGRFTIAELDARNPVFINERMLGKNCCLTIEVGHKITCGRTVFQLKTKTVSGD